MRDPGNEVARAAGLSVSTVLPSFTIGKQSRYYYYCCCYCNCSYYCCCCSSSYYYYNEWHEGTKEFENGTHDLRVTGATVYQVNYEQYEAINVGTKQGVNKLCTSEITHSHIKLQING